MRGSHPWRRFTFSSLAINVTANVEKEALRENNKIIILSNCQRFAGPKMNELLTALSSLNAISRCTKRNNRHSQKMFRTSVSGRSQSQIWTTHIRHMDIAHCRAEIYEHNYTDQWDVCLLLLLLLKEWPVRRSNNKNSPLLWVAIRHSVDIGIANLTIIVVILLNTHP